MQIFKDTSVYMLGEVLSKAFPFLLLPYLTRRLGVEGFGELSLCLMWLSIVTMVVGLSQEGAVARYFFYKGTKYLELIVCTAHLIAFLLSLPLLIVGIVLSSPMILTVSLAGLLQSFFYVQLSLRQCQKRPLSYVLIQMLNAVGSMGLTVLVFECVSASSYNRVLVILIVNLLTVALGVTLYSRKNKVLLGLKGVTRSKVLVASRYILNYGVPLIPHQLSFFVRGQLDRLLIYSVFSTYALGVYSAGYQLASIYMVMLGAINNAVLPYYFESLKKNKVNAKKVLSLFKWSFFTVPLVSFVAYCLPVGVYGFVLGSGFDGVKSIVCLFLLGMGFQVPYLIVVNYMFYYGKNSRVSFCTILSSVLYIGLVYFFSRYSLEMVPLALLVSNVFCITLLYLEFRKTAAEELSRCRVVPL